MNVELEREREEYRQKRECDRLADHIDVFLHRPPEVAGAGELAVLVAARDALSRVSRAVVAAWDT